MLSERPFTRFSRTSKPPRIEQIPDGGFCLSSFVILTRTGKPNEVLLGKLDVNGPWDRVGALDKERAERNSKGWMLPASQLIYGESPQEAAKRILSEQLGLHDQKLDGPLVFSEVYGPKNHWDLEFLFTGERAEVGPHAAWRELGFVDMRKLRKEDFARSHEDILAHLGNWKG
ncbi:MAG: NUDIX hydrolase [Nitrososphaerales archaeon]|nr:NUDIX hydrolase [Nitrososphaerales archaeon]